MNTATTRKTYCLALTSLLAMLTACGGGSSTPAAASSASTSSSSTVSSSSASSASSTSSSTSSTSSSSSAASVSFSQVFALLDPGESANSMSQYAAMSNVSGLAFRALWSALEPTAGTYNWTAIDAAFDAVRLQNKQLTVHVGTSGGGWPAWLVTAGAATYTYNSPQGAAVTDPVPWDSVFLSRYHDFVVALATHIQTRGDSSLLRAVSVGAPVAEMSLVGCSSNTLGTTTSVPYSRSNYLQAWQNAINSVVGAWPGKPVFISAPIAIICRPDTDGQAFYSDVMSYARGLNGSVAIFAADLNATGSARMAQVNTSLSTQLPIGLQTIWSASNDPSNRMAGSLHSAVCAGLTLGARYFEIYKADLNSTDPTIQAAIATAQSGQGCP
jgi:Beta-galactosidase